ncbi:MULTISPECIES: S-type pyocin domain-containing protein, partial [unclassified Pseudomonas]|uniref:S-type pyocin domain-containing protein n=1 Tax=unclassified Pseudomonas TaxID=196821 RepID=UPI0021BB997A
IAAAKAKAEADRIAAAKAKAEADRIVAANTYTVPGSVAGAGSVIIIAAGHLRTAVTYVSVGRVLTTAVGALIGFAGSVAAGLVAGVSALIYSPRLGNGELPVRYALQTPLTDLDPLLSAALPSISSASHVDLPFRLSSRVTEQDESEIFVVKTDGVIVPSRAPVLNARYDAQRNVYIASTADIPPRTLSWTPIVTPGDASTTLPPEQPEPSIYEGAKLKPVEVRIDSFPEVADASWDDYVIVFPADSGLPPIYTMFRDRRGEPGIIEGHGQAEANIWLSEADTGKGSPIPSRIADLLRGKEVRNWRNFRESFWKTVADDPILSRQFSRSNLTLMRGGSAPYAIPDEHIGGNKVYEIHHDVPLRQGGELYNIDNLRIVTPKRHVTIHSKRIKQ